MGHYRYLVFTNPAEGREDEYNTWYDMVHLGEVLEVPGFNAAERYRIEAPEAEHRYLAIYEFEANDPAVALAELPARVADGRIAMPPVLGENVKTVLYQVITPRMTRKDPNQP